MIDAMTTFAYGAIVLVGVSETRPALTLEATRARRQVGSVKGMLAPLRDRPFVSFALIHVLLLVAFAQVIVALPLDMRAHGLGVRQIGFLLGLNGLLIVLVQPLALRYVRGFRHVHWLAAGALLTGLGLGATAFAGGVVVYVVSATLWTVGEVGFSTASPAIVAELAPVAQRGTYQGAFQLTWGTAIMVAPVLGSLVLARLGSSALWGSCLVACLVAAALHLRVTSGARRSRPS